MSDDLVWRMRFISFIVTLSLACSARAMSLNDVSVLLPLPTAQDYAQLLAPANEGRAGVLIPQDLYTRFGRFAQGYATADLYTHGFRVIGVRIDPCFVEGYGPQTCRHQIRLVWQPVLVAGATYTTLDTALHSFYEFQDESEWRQILASWPVQAANSSAVQVHPQMRAQSLNGSYWQALKSVILAHCGQQKLVRLTAISSNTTAVTGAPAIVWLFQGFDVHAGVAARMTIPLIGRPTQVLINTAASRDEFEGEMQPAPATINWINFFKNSAAVRANPAVAKDVVADAITIENPQRANPGTVDCVSCQVSQETRHWGESRFAQAWNWASDFTTRYQSSLNLQNSTRAYGTDHLRSFGYFGQDPVISQRLINETAAVVKSFGG